MKYFAIEKTKVFPVVGNKSMFSIELGRPGYSDYRVATFHILNDEIIMLSSAANYFPQLNQKILNKIFLDTGFRYLLTNIKLLHFKTYSWIKPESLIYYTPYASSNLSQMTIAIQDMAFGLDEDIISKTTDSLSKSVVTYKDMDQTVTFGNCQLILKDSVIRIESNELEMNAERNMFLSIIKASEPAINTSKFEYFDIVFEDSFKTENEVYRVVLGGKKDYRDRYAAVKTWLTATP